MSRLTASLQSIKTSRNIFTHKPILSNITLQADTTSRLRHDCTIYGNLLFIFSVIKNKYNLCSCSSKRSLLMHLISWFKSSYMIFGLKCYLTAWQLSLNSLFFYVNLGITPPLFHSPFLCYPSSHFINSLSLFSLYTHTHTQYPSLVSVLHTLPLLLTLPFLFHARLLRFTSSFLSSTAIQASPFSLLSSLFTFPFPGAVSALSLFLPPKLTLKSTFPSFLFHTFTNPFCFPSH